MKSVQATVDRWKGSAAQAQQSYTEGVQGTNVDVMARAIAAAPAMVQAFNEAVTSGRWARAITESGGTAKWKANAVAKANNYSTGIQAGADAYQRAMSKLMPYMAQGVQSLPAKVPGSIASSKARVNAFIDYMHAGKGQFKG